MRKIVIHTSIWAAWYLLNSLSIFGMLQQLSPIQWLQIAYNYCSLIMVFYAVCYFSTRYFYQLSYSRMNELKGIDFLKYLFFRWQLLGVLFIAACYLALSMWLDNTYFGYQYENELIHADQRLTREMAYIVFSVSYSYYMVYSIRQKKRLTSNRARIISMQKKYLELKELAGRVTVTQNETRKIR